MTRWSEWDSICPVCRATTSGDQHVESTDVFCDAILVKCPRCGTYAITFRENRSLKLTPFSPPDIIKVSALLHEQSLRSRLPKFWLQTSQLEHGPLNYSDLTPIGTEELLSRWPTTVIERLNRSLCNLAHMSPNAGHQLPLARRNDTTNSLLFASNSGEADFHIAALEERGDIVRTPSSSHDYVHVSIRGWDRFDRLTRETSNPESPVFVAMWFGSSDGALTPQRMREVYERGIERGINRAAYRAIRVDMEQFNDSIMDQVLGDIRAAPFVVADFTGHRNGVYFEAGFAKGLGRQVIHTCEESWIEKAHFDTRHINHILWKNEEELQERLYQRIRGTLGVGPFPPADLHGPISHR